MTTIEPYQNILTTFPKKVLKLTKIKLPQTHNMSHIEEKYKISQNILTKFATILYTFQRKALRETFPTKERNFMKKVS